MRRHLLLAAALVGLALPATAGATGDAPTNPAIDSGDEVMLAHADEEVVARAPAPPTYRAPVARPAPRAQAAPTTSPSTTFAPILLANAAADTSGDGGDEGETDDEGDSPGLAGPDESGVDPGEDPGGWLSASLAAVRGGEPLLAAALLVIGLTWAARRWGPQILKGDRAGVILAGTTALLGGIAHTVVAGGSLSPGLVLDALAVALAAMGGYSGVRKLLWPKDAAGASS